MIPARQPASEETQTPAAVLASYEYISLILIILSFSAGVLFTPHRASPHVEQRVSPALHEPSPHQRPSGRMPQRRLFVPGTAAAVAVTVRALSALLRQHDINASIEIFQTPDGARRDVTDAFALSIARGMTLSRALRRAGAPQSSFVISVVPRARQIQAMVTFFAEGGGVDDANR